MKNLIRSKFSGFTLIELLIVIMIIGVLTAIAVPMYQGAVDKSHWSTLLPSAKALKDAEEAVRMSSGSYTSEMKNLDVSLDADGGVEYQLQIRADGNDFNRVRGTNPKLNNVRLSNYLIENTYLGGQLHCEAKSGDKRAERLCGKLLMGQELFPTDDGYVAYLLDQNIDSATCDYIGKYWSAKTSSCHDSAEEACTANGGTYSDICYESEQAACEGNGGSWNGSECGMDECSGEHADEAHCLGQEACSERGYWWVEGSGCFDDEGVACDTSGKFRGIGNRGCYDTEEEACHGDGGADSGYWDSGSSTCYADERDWCESSGMYYGGDHHAEGQGCFANAEEACANGPGTIWSESLQQCYYAEDRSEMCEDEGGHWSVAFSECYDTQEEVDQAECEMNPESYWVDGGCYTEEELCSKNGGIYDGMCYDDPDAYCESWGMTWNGSECYVQDDYDPFLGFLISYYDPATSSVVFPVSDLADFLGENIECDPDDGRCRTDNNFISQDDCSALGGDGDGDLSCKFPIENACYFLGAQYNTGASYDSGKCALTVD